VSRPVLSVIIVSYGTRDLTLTALESVRIRRHEVELEAVVVDNASPDDSADAVEREHPWVTLIRAPENRGFAAGANRGAREAAGEWLLFLNPDARLTDGAMTGLLAAARNLPRPGAVGPRIEGPRGTESSVGRYYGPWRDLVRAFALYRIFPGVRAFEDVHLRRLPAETTPVEWVTGAALLVQAQAFREVGGFDEDYFLYVEDMDLCYRLAGQGRRNLYVPSVVVHHEGSRSPRPRRVLAEGGDAAEIFVRKAGMRYPILLQRGLQVIMLLRWLGVLRVRLLLRRIRGREIEETRDSLRLCRKSLDAALRRGIRPAGRGGFPGDPC
jgi:N-acetylglucosaminyl-diphospho-decaprenol L-rhamnosyltransferase